MTCGPPLLLIRCKRLLRASADDVGGGDGTFTRRDDKVYGMAMAGENKSLPVDPKSRIEIPQESRWPGGRAQGTSYLHVPPAHQEMFYACLCTEIT